MRRATFVFVFFVVLLDMLALGIIVPVLPMLILEFEGGDTSGAAAIFGVFATAWAFMQFLCAPVLGALSDRFGRRPVILISCLGLGLDYFLMALAPDLTWLFVGRVISGITSASFATAYAYIADVTPPGERAGKYGLLGAAFGIGFVVGPALGGLLGDVSLRLPFWVAGALSLANVAYGYFVLPESLPADERAPFSWRSANPVGAMGLLASHRAVISLAAVVFIYRVAHEALPSLFVLYTDFRYGWTESDVGWALAAVGVASMVVQAGLVGRVVTWLGEQTALLVGLAFGTAGFLVYALAPTGGIFLIGIPLMGLYGFTYPSLQGLLTRRVGRDEQGRLQGALASLMGVAGILAPLMFTQTFAAAVGPYRELGLPGAPFLLAGAFLVVGIVLVIVEILGRPVPDREPPGGGDDGAQEAPGPAQPPPHGVTAD